MNNVNKTLYIPLYGKAYVSRKGIILCDKKAEEIWQKEGFPLHGKAMSKWLAYYMGMRASVFDSWVKEQMLLLPDATVIHIGCGMDSRAQRVGTGGHPWYDVDFPDVIAERKRYFQQTDTYSMLACDARDTKWLENMPKGRNAILVMEGISMYLRPEEMQHMLAAINHHLGSTRLLVDIYTAFAARISKYKNPINDVGVTTVYGLDDPRLLEKGAGMVFVKEHNITPDSLIHSLGRWEKRIFRKVFAGSFSRKMYRLYEYTSHGLHSPAPKP